MVKADFNYLYYLRIFLNIKEKAPVSFCLLKEQHGFDSFAFCLISFVHPDKLFNDNINIKNLVFVELDMNNYLFPIIQLILLSQKSLKGKYNEDVFLVLKDCQTLFVCINVLFSSLDYLGDWSGYNKEVIGPLFKRIFNDSYLTYFVNKQLQFYKNKLLYNDINLSNYKKYEHLSNILKLNIVDLTFFIQTLRDFVKRMSLFSEKKNFMCRICKVTFVTGNFNFKFVDFNCTLFIKKIDLSFKNKGV